MLIGDGVNQACQLSSGWAEDTETFCRSKAQSMVGGAGGVDAGPHRQLRVTRSSVLYWDSAAKTLDTSEPRHPQLLYTPPYMSSAMLQILCAYCA